MFNFIILTLIFYILINLISKKKEKNTYKKNIEEYYDIDKFLELIEIHKKSYFTNSMKETLKEKYNNLYYKFTEGELKNVNSSNVNIFRQTYRDIDELVKVWNQNYIESELLKNNELFSNIDGKSLDEQQRRAVVIDEDNNLILAGAGSGKTLTIAAKVKYLVEQKNIKENEILLISFTKKAADEMNQRICEKLGVQVEARTFHKLGLDIISKKQGYRVEVADELLDRVINDYFKENIYYDKKILKELIIFLGFYVNVPKEIDSFENIGEYYKYCKGLDLTTLKGKEQINKIEIEIEALEKEKKTIKGERVKSLEEVIIANFLYLNGVEYEYEMEYPYSTGNKFRKKYRPDFYLPEYNIYIEHFGINRNKRAPHLSRIEEIKYLDDMEFKVNLHYERETKLIKTYSYYHSEGILLKKLRDKLIHEGVKLNEIDPKIVFKTIYNNKEDKYFKELRKLIHTFITLFKSKGYTLLDFDNLNKDVLKINNKFLRERNKILLNIIKNIYLEYENILHKNNEIDFNDMINKSTEIVKNSDVNMKYKYIIIDEYQDISVSRFNLIKEIKKQTGAKLICVGDDWQSIYRFTGSDLDLLTNFGDYVGYYELLKIEKTYRNSQELIDIASKFILKNKRQIVKNLKSDKVKSNPIKIINYTQNVLTAFEKAIEAIVDEYGDNAQITLLSRNNYDKNILTKENTNGKFELKGNNENVIIKSKKYPKLKMNFLTVHRSKGLEADNVIILNMENKMSGFPNQIEDDPILDLVLTQLEQYIFAEERRLFYVALTRTKNNCYLLVPESRSSIFCDELVESFKIKTQSVDRLESEKVVKCPKCLVGNLVHRKNNKGSYSFVSCSNYPVCDYRTNSIEVLDNPVECKSCGGFMVRREYNGEIFLGCTNYPYCRNKEIYNEEDYINTKEDSWEITEDYISNEINAIIYEEKLCEPKIDNEKYLLSNMLEPINDEMEHYNISCNDYQEKKTIDIYCKNNEKSNYIFDKTCITNVELNKGDIIRDYNRCLVIDFIESSNIFVEEIHNIRFPITQIVNKILTIYVNGEYYKKYITNTNYSVGDRFEYKECKFIVTNIFKDTIFTEKIIETTNEEVIEENHDSRLELENYRIKKVKEQLLFFAYEKDIPIELRLWLRGFIEYIDNNCIIDLFSNIELLQIVECNKFINENVLLQYIDYLKLIDIRGFDIELSYIEDIVGNRITVAELKIWELNNKLQNLNDDFVGEILWIKGLVKFIEGKDLSSEFTSHQLSSMIFVSEKVCIEYFELQYVTIRDIKEYNKTLDDMIYQLI